MRNQWLTILVGFSLSCNSQLNDVTGVVFNSGKDSIQLGTVINASSKDFTFPIENQTSNKIKIVGIEGSCSCVNFRYDSIVEPNKTISVRGTYTINEKDSSKHTATEILEAISIRTSGTEQPLKVICVTGKIEQ